MKKDRQRFSSSFHYRKVKPKDLRMAAAILSKWRQSQSLRSRDSFGARVCAVEIRLEPESAVEIRLEPESVQ